MSGPDIPIISSTLPEALWQAVCVGREGGRGNKTRDGRGLRVESLGSENGGMQQVREGKGEGGEEGGREEHFKNFSTRHYRALNFLRRVQRGQ